MNALLGREGNRSIPVDEYPPGHMEAINKTLNAIAAQEDAPGLPFEEDDEGWADRAAEAVLRITTRGGFAVLGIVAGGLVLIVVGAQVGRWIS